MERDSGNQHSFVERSEGRALAGNSSEGRGLQACYSVEVSAGSAPIGLSRQGLVQRIAENDMRRYR